MQTIRMDEGQEQARHGDGPKIGDVTGAAVAGLDRGVHRQQAEREAEARAAAAKATAKNGWRVGKVEPAGDSAMPAFAVTFIAPDPAALQAAEVKARQAVEDAAKRVREKFVTSSPEHKHYLAERDRLAAAKREAEQARGEAERLAGEWEKAVKIDGPDLAAIEQKRDAATGKAERLTLRLPVLERAAAEARATAAAALKSTFVAELDRLKGEAMAGQDKCRARLADLAGGLLAEMQAHQAAIQGAADVLFQSPKLAALPE